MTKVPIIRKLVQWTSSMEWFQYDRETGNTRKLLVSGSIENAHLPDRVHV